MAYIKAGVVGNNHMVNVYDERDKLFQEFDGSINLLYRVLFLKATIQMSGGFFVLKDQIFLGNK